MLKGYFSSWQRAAFVSWVETRLLLPHGHSVSFGVSGLLLWDNEESAKRPGDTLFSQGVINGKQTLCDVLSEIIQR